MMPEVVLTIAGHSGAGKKTLLWRLLTEPTDGPLRRRFGLDGPGRFAVYGHLEGFPGPEWMPTATRPRVIHHWQDASHGWVELARRIFPDADHRVILLRRDWSAQAEALAARPGDYRPIPEELRDRWREDVLPPFLALESAGIALDVADASTPGYDPIPRDSWPG